ncbi:hypothetical protein M0534_12045 [Methylonatrum kenyense]|uniref:hypothetical protein n=1 Tax=Methylonatrum kenyense TaxID=455253 RepID=UPI0020C156D6|nr:hypothetical protein [Methylonatrum kenyense]MCK8517051.1 hypothetical protein [Methylonatrum kenyense]
MADSGTTSSAELRRLQEELAAARKRLEAEESRFQARLENQRTRLEAESLRQQAAEVSRRRQLEQEVSALHERLAKVDAAVPDAAEEWHQRNAELEQALAAEQRNAASLEEELMLTRQALNLSERARATARGRALRLAEVLRELRHQIEQTTGKRFAGRTRPFDGTQVGEGNVQEVDLGRANAVLLEVERALDRDDGDAADDSPEGSYAGDESWLEGFLDLPEDQSFDVETPAERVEAPAPPREEPTRPAPQPAQPRQESPPPASALQRSQPRRPAGFWRSLLSRLSFRR